MVTDKNKIKRNELFKTIYPMIKERKILDVGCVEHSAIAKDKNPFWVHDFLKDNGNVLGIDILKNDISILTKKGYNMVVGNAETFELFQEFDIIFAGELIEHLSNPGLFLQQSKKHMGENSLLILTTPNTFYSPRLFKCIGKMTDDPEVNMEHTNWFSPTTIRTLLEREGFDILNIKRFDAVAEDMPMKARIKRSINRTFRQEVKGSLLIIAKIKTEVKST